MLSLSLADLFKKTSALQAHAEGDHTALSEGLRACQAQDLEWLLPLLAGRLPHLWTHVREPWLGMLLAQSRAATHDDLNLAALHAFMRRATAPRHASDLAPWVNTFEALSEQSRTILTQLMRTSAPALSETSILGLFTKAFGRSHAEMWRLYTQSRSLLELAQALLDEKAVLTQPAFMKPGFLESPYHLSESELDTFLIYAAPTGPRFHVSWHQGQVQCSLEELELTAHITSLLQGFTEKQALFEGYLDLGTQRPLLWDLLELNGEDLRDRPLVERLSRLSALVPGQACAPYSRVQSFDALEQALSTLSPTSPYGLWLKKRHSPYHLKDQDFLWRHLPGRSESFALLKLYSDDAGRPLRAQIGAWDSEEPRSLVALADISLSKALRESLMQALANTPDGLSGLSLRAQVGRLSLALLHPAGLRVEDLRPLEVERQPSELSLDALAETYHLRA